jgi:hypothetical protein
MTYSIKEFTKMTYSIKGFKEFMGMEDKGYNLTLLCDGRKVATAIYGGDGGEPNVYFIDKKDEEIFNTFLKTLSPVKSDFFPEGLDMTPDIYLGNLINDYQEKTQLKRWCKKKIVAVRKGDPKGSYITFSVPYSKEVAVKLRNAHPNIVEIINERFV